MRYYSGVPTMYSFMFLHIINVILVTVYISYATNISYFFSGNVEANSSESEENLKNNSMS